MEKQLQEEGEDMLGIVYCQMVKLETIIFIDVIPYHLCCSHLTSMINFKLNLK